MFEEERSSSPKQQEQNVDFRVRNLHQISLVQSQDPIRSNPDLLDRGQFARFKQRSRPQWMYER